MNNSATLTLLIQPTRVAEGPVDINRLKSLPPGLQVERLRIEAALSALLEGMNSGLPVPQMLGAIVTLQDIRKALCSPQAVLRRVPSSTRKDQGNLHGRAPPGSADGLPHHLLGTALVGSHPSTASLGPLQHTHKWHPAHGTKPAPPPSARGSSGRPPSPPGRPPPWDEETSYLTAKVFMSLDVYFVLFLTRTVKTAAKGYVNRH